MQKITRVGSLRLRVSQGRPPSMIFFFRTGKTRKISLVVPKRAAMASSKLFIWSLSSEVSAPAFTFALPFVPNEDSLIAFPFLQFLQVFKVVEHHGHRVPFFIQSECWRVGKHSQSPSLSSLV